MTADRRARQKAGYEPARYESAAYELARPLHRAEFCAGHGPGPPAATVAVSALLVLAHAVAMLFRGANVFSRPHKRALHFPTFMLFSASQREEKKKREIDGGTGSAAAPKAGSETAVSAEVPK